MLFTEIKLPENNCYYSIRSSKILGVDLEENKITVLIEDDKMSELVLFFDTYADALSQYESIMEDLRNTIV
ncbi:MAG: hypothetical protein J6T10_27950 [Methanobrevibacter sp.]|nr:hypothetical protein [Methanobrevibacter sp.]